jgi:hypothetical protein
MAASRSKPKGDRRETLSYVQVPLKGLAISMAILALACLTSLIIVVAVRKENLLATIALSLAIVTFVVQIIVYVVQASVASEQLMQSQTLFGTIQGLLVKVDEKASGTQAAVTTMSDKMLATLLSPREKEASEFETAERDAIQTTPRPFQTTPEQRASETSTSAEAATRETRSTASPATNELSPEQAALVERARERITELSPDITPRYPQKTDEDRARDLTILARLTSFPEQPEARELADEIASLSPDELGLLQRMATDELRYRDPARTLLPALQLDNEVAEPLSNRGILRRVSQNDATFYGLTAHGRELARLLVAPDPLPDFLSDIRKFRDFTN